MPGSDDITKANTKEGMTSKEAMSFFRAEIQNAEIKHQRKKHVEKKSGNNLRKDPPNGQGT